MRMHAIADTFVKELYCWRHMRNFCGQGLLLGHSKYLRYQIHVYAYIYNYLTFETRHRLYTCTYVKMLQLFQHVKHHSRTCLQQELVIKKTSTQRGQDEFIN